PYVFQDLATPALYSLSLHDALPICQDPVSGDADRQQRRLGVVREPQFLFRTLETEAAQRKAQGGVGFLEHFPGDSKSLIQVPPQDRKSTRLNSSHVKISYAVFCLKK